ncbi:MAG: hypothetical protein ACE37F_24055 [Nannocystaceae bacterium]|nr:hypothetical protein [bacterium]
MTRLLAFALLTAPLGACDDGGNDDGGADGSGGSSGVATTASSSGGASSASASGSGTPQTSTSDSTSSTGDSDVTTAGADTTGDASTGETSAEGSSGGASTGSSTGQSSLPIDCDDGDLPVRVEGGGSYSEVSAGVAATPPGGTVYICPGEYTEDATMEIDFPISVVGAGPNLVHIETSASFMSGQSDGAGFNAVNSGFTLEGFTLEGGRYGVSVFLYQGPGHEVVIRDVTFRGSDDAGVYISGGANPPDDASATFEGMIVEDVQGAVDAAVAIRDISSTFVDSIIRDNVTEHGGLYVQDAPVVFEGGQVIRNTATETNGGGAYIQSGFPYPEFVITGSDWGEGAANENAPNDFDCGNSTDVGWLGAPANATCATNDGDCCTPD